jgi:hypothetical protein
VSLDMTEVVGASGSAIKGLKLVRTVDSATSAAQYHIASVGYDQRLSVWGVRVHCESESEDAVQVQWKAGSMVNVSDVGAVDLLVQRSEEGATNVTCCVAGEGLQLFAVTL